MLLALDVLEAEAARERFDEDSIAAAVARTHEQIDTLQGRR